jgi:hypothetical protein
MAGMSPLRRRMTEDMTVRNLSPATQRLYAICSWNRAIAPDSSLTRRRQVTLSRDLADVENGEHVDPNHVQVVRDVDTFVRHRVVASAWSADDALHAGEMEEMSRIGTIKARW